MYQLLFFSPILCASIIFNYFSLLYVCFTLRFMNTVKNTKNVTIFFSLPFFVLLPYLTTLLCCISLLDECFSSQIHEHREEHKKDNSFFFSLRSFVLLPYLTSFLSFSMFHKYFHVRFMNTVKNTKKSNNISSFFCDFLFFYI